MGDLTVLDSSTVYFTSVPNCTKVPLSVPLSVLLSKNDDSCFRLHLSKNRKSLLGFEESEVRD